MASIKTILTSVLGVVTLLSAVQGAALVPYGAGISSGTVYGDGGLQYGDLRDNNAAYSRKVETNAGAEDISANYYNQGPSYYQQQYASNSGPYSLPVGGNGPILSGGYPAYMGGGYPSTYAGTTAMNGGLNYGSYNKNKATLSHKEDTNAGANNLAATYMNQGPTFYGQQHEQYLPGGPSYPY